MTIEKCFYLNLDKNTDRRKHLEHELNRSNLLKDKCERVSAVDGSLIHPRYVKKGLLTENAIDDILSEMITAWGLSITQGALGVILSYISLFEKIKDLKTPVITFEDDIKITENFDDYLNEILKELPDDFDVCYLGYGDTTIESTTYSKHLSIPKGRITCLPGLVISPSGAEKLLDLIKNLDNQIDTAITEHFNKLKVFISNQKIVQIPNEHGSDIQGNKNCKKNYAKQNYIFSTLAIGNDSNKKALLLSKDLKYFDQKILIVTDQPETFETAPNVITHYFKPNKFSYNHKIICFEEGFKLAEAVVCVDSDCRILYKTYKNTLSRLALIIPPGFHPSWDWGLIARHDSNFFQSKDVCGRVSGYGELALSLCKEKNIDYEQAYHFQEGVVVVSKENGKENIFLENWSYLANKLDQYELDNESGRIGVGEGNLIGLALVKSGMTKHSPEVCNILGENIKYNFYGGYREETFKNCPGRKMVPTAYAEEITSKSVFVKFKDKQISLDFSLNKVDESTYMIAFEWNKNNAVEFLDHEFKVNGNVFHFESEKTNELYFKKESSLEVFHSFDWYGEKDWKQIL